MKKVSVIVPVFNTEKYLRRCLDSLVNQTLKDIEIIVVNDCSTDNSRKILDYYEEKYKSILKVFHNESNRGIGYSRNLGMEKAEGEYLCFLDSDDWVKLDMYEKMYKKAKLESLDLVICNYDKKKMDNDGNFSKIENDYVIPEYSVTCLKSTPELLLTVNMGPTNKLYKKTLLKNIRFPIDLKYEDMIVIVKSLANSKRIGFVKESLVYYLVHSKSETTVMDKRVFDIFKITDLALEFLKKQKYYSKISEYVEAFVIRNIFRYTLQQKNQKSRALRRKFIDEAFNYLDNNFPKWRNNKIWKKRNAFKRLIESNKSLTKLYCDLF